MRNNACVWPINLQKQNGTKRLKYLKCLLVVYISNKCIVNACGSVSRCVEVCPETKSTRKTNYKK